MGYINRKPRSDGTAGKFRLSQPYCSSRREWSARFSVIYPIDKMITCFIDTSTSTIQQPQLYPRRIPPNRFVFALQKNLKKYFLRRWQITPCGGSISTLKKHSHLAFCQNGGWTLHYVATTDTSCVCRRDFARVVAWYKPLFSFYGG